jgi:hypothetical protein
MIDRLYLVYDGQAGQLYLVYDGQDDQMESLGWEREVRRESRQLTSNTSMLDTPARHLHHTIR